MNTVHSQYRPDIDGLRAVAILSVIFYHAFPSLLQGGFVGVDIFFVISGYLITKLILQSLYLEQFSVKGFYVRRIKRIFPSLIVVLATCLVLGWFFMLFDEYKMLAKSVIAGTLFYSNIYFFARLVILIRLPN
ncbi:acyltransferase [Herbaspirillum sp. RTI4]|uniref:acyltransferase family protein n=1 Tax=Herbaspirillum sp. RTI4 TaxID=3048640 RepID=UPI002AB4E9FB|nr:acyltransferase [Herbaspirillum sp. RTI4]MDY7577598.1 acyltransferase [Herbaspirillum sp. RTI4]